ncbi:hypothetical protein FIU86_14580 [Roseovarius sp. THAF9]|uniref:hypothetical protein n=1 Tax=Roseovarius sp. THAF9 TaxID=2587847 RepID=UPI00126818A8|nr:hypothetical protein [Roseovarius sp. THAF9]QFT94073.1 hypothetical protein FIU86_14580 [Roseovarius sp. THAF9]
MFKILERFAKSEEGAVTVDWVVLTAGIVGMAVGAIQTVGDANEALGNSASTAIATQSVKGVD